MAGFITMRAAAIAGVRRATAPQISHCTESARYAAQSRDSPERRTSASIFRCAGATAIMNAKPEMLKRTIDQKIHPVPRMG